MISDQCGADLLTNFKWYKGAQQEEKFLKNKTKATDIYKSRWDQWWTSGYVGLVIEKSQFVSI